ncbi:ABC-type branched-chain amino acid transport system, periplasmic component [Cupriavidus necator]|uniref:ABC-type transporter, periplasmic component: HAAT family n=1 Tax=Cupriavidus necator (strain ATCC 17699 / DSM 428 / KCTC 22496 / NCIMB 10442 / H16 / Stanier 337) TaxID=381666 RepID=Q0KCT6_CUPNH|nr:MULTISPECIES: branched-chain amino acid ABC transporter substrate-binding protein [Cupriavidus]EON21750.1 ABC transporter periplasmic protein [Cupriavidus sp. GA3-3]KUE85192.1 ABC transporter permease [Cupriavidus necator]QCC00094.1 branched-chain amino acid ABC transporter substrate-binding protein [Cupriavidus necator H16]QQB77092.1 branched-chain amino acid ABC transporter substrate-binding protein [Cupriavidus necator]WKA41947.1 branched-chain amino acid ABC transporter substrate-bindin
MKVAARWRGWLGGLLLAAAAGASAQEPIRLGMIDGLSGPFANAGEAVTRNLRLAIERINARGGVKTAEGARPMELVTFDSKGNVDESLIQLRALTDKRIPFVLQGNSSAVAGALVSAINRHNARQPDARVLFLNYSAVDPSLTNENCSFWHFRFDASADMRMQALTEVIRQDQSVRKVYLIDQDYSFGHQVSRSAREMLAARRPDIQIVGDEFHPIGKIKDFAPYIAKIKASGADAVITGNWGNDLTLMVKAAREGGLQAKFYTFYGNGLGAPAAMGDAGVGRVLAVAEWHPNVGGAASDAFYQQFRARYPEPKDDYVHLRMQMMVEMLARAIEQAGSTDAVKVAGALENMRYVNQFHEATVRADDHQVLQPLYVSVMERQGGAVRFDNEGSGYGFRTVRKLKAAQTTLPTTCRMERP